MEASQLDPKRTVYKWRLSREELEKLISVQEHYNAKSLNEALQKHLQDLKI
jgi:hypothetical protein